MKVATLTLGCKVNQYETQAMVQLLQSAGFTLCNQGEEADVVLLNSCTVTATSDQKVQKALHRIRRTHPHAVVVLTGCMPQAFPEEAAALLEADIVLGNSNRKHLLPHILAYLQHPQRIVDITPHKDGDPYEELHIAEFSGHTRAFVKIEDGCNRFCSYCIIPYARGRVRSKPLSALKKELSSLAENGFREVVLTGINLSCYGQDLGLHLTDAVALACSISGIDRVRLGSLEPEQLSPGVIATLSKEEKLCPQFHLSLQSGCDATLQRMHRHYTTAEYRTIVENLRKAFPNCAITTDIMVGFPGETEEEFAESLAFAREIAFAKVHVFAYSRRPGTVADKLPDQVPETVKAQRSKAMIAVTNETQRDFLQKQIGTTQKVLVERAVGEALYEGHTTNYTTVQFAAKEDVTNQIVPVTLTQVEGTVCRGEMLDYNE